MQSRIYIKYITVNDKNKNEEPAIYEFLKMHEIHNHKLDKIFLDDKVKDHLR